MQPVLTRCPLCAEPTFVEKVRCTACASALEGRFTLDWPGSLSREQLSFVKVFLTARGKIKDVEEALGISYPTVVARLDEVVAAIAEGKPAPAAPPQPQSRARAHVHSPPPQSAAQRKQILDDLAAGTIDADEAAKRLRNT
jgi:hypothetical protein